MDVHCTTKKRHDTQLGWQVTLRNAGGLHSLAGDKGYDWMVLHEKLRDKGVRPLLKHQEFRPVNHAHNVRIDGLTIGNELSVSPSSPRSSVHSETPCVSEYGTGNFENSS